MTKAWMYILKCGNGLYYTGSTIDIDFRMKQHEAGEGSNFTSKHLPIALVYYEEYASIEDAFLREKQIQGWSRKKKEALINDTLEKLPEFLKNYTENGQTSLRDLGDNS